MSFSKPKLRLKNDFMLLCFSPALRYLLKPSKANLASVVERLESVAARHNDICYMLYFFLKITILTKPMIPSSRFVLRLMRRLSFVTISRVCFQKYFEIREVKPKLFSRFILFFFRYKLCFHNLIKSVLFLTSKLKELQF